MSNINCSDLEFLVSPQDMDLEIGTRTRMAREEGDILVSIPMKFIFNEYIINYIMDASEEVLL